MAGKNTVQRVEEIVKPFAEALSLDLWDITFTKEGTDWYLRIYIDKSGGVSIDDCVDLTHAVTKPLDEADPISQSYMLEVSSPGVERELKKDWHFEKYLGSPVTVRTIRFLKNFNKERLIGKMSNEFFEAVRMLEEEKGLSAEYLFEKISGAIIVAAKREYYHDKDIVFCDIDPEKEKIKVYVRKNVVEEIEDEDADILIDDALEIRKSAKVGKTIDIPLKTKDFGRIVAQTAKNVIRQGIREGEKGKQFEEFQNKNQELVTAKIHRIDPVTGNATVEIGKTLAMLPKAEQVPGEVLTEGESVKIFIVDVIQDNSRGPKIMLSRTHKGLVRRLFETEVPEIYDGTIEIKSVSREAGSRTKIAVYSKDENVDAVGACIGPRGQRVSAIVDALGGEKIDIVTYSEDNAEFISASLAPSDVCGVEILDEDKKICRATVPDDQLSLAIGNKGQNVRLAAKLTGWKIDIKPESGFYEGTQE